MKHEYRDDIEGKTCTKCHEWRPLTDYYRQSSCSDGLTTQCQPCNKERVNRYEVENRETVQETARRSREKNHDAILTRQRIYKEENRLLLAKKQREYCARHPEHNAKFYKEHPGYRAKYVKDHYEHRREVSRQWCENHREERKARRRAWRKERGFIARANIQRYRARKNGAPGVEYTTPAKVASRIELWGGLCYICGKPADAVDHVKPLAHGGAHLPCNLRPICKACNGRKSGRWPYDFAQARKAAL